VTLTTNLLLVPRSKNEWRYTSTPNTPPRRGAQLKHRHNFTFTFTFSFSRRVLPLRDKRSCAKYVNVAETENDYRMLHFFNERWSEDYRVILVFERRPHQPCAPHLTICGMRNIKCFIESGPSNISSNQECRMFHRIRNVEYFVEPGTSNVSSNQDRRIFHRLHEPLANTRGVAV
jgi:hypothetical protein